MKTLPALIPMLWALLSAVTVCAQNVELEKPKIHGGFFGFAFAPDGTILAGGTGTVRFTVGAKAEVGGGQLMLWDAKTGRVRRTLGRDGSTIDWVRFSADGAVLASASEDDGVVKIWDAQSGALQQTLKLESALGRGPAGATLLCVLSEDGKSLATVTVTKKSVGKANVPAGYHLAVWNTATGSRRWELSNSNVHSLTFTDDGKTLVAFAETVEWTEAGNRIADKSSDEHLVAWEAESGKELFRNSTGKSSPSFLASLPPAEVVMLMNRKLIFINGRTGETIKETKFQSPKAFYYAITFSTDHKRFVAAQPSGHAVDWFEVENGQRVATQEFQPDQIWSAVFSSDLKRMACVRAHKPIVVELEPTPIESP